MDNKELLKGYREMLFIRRLEEKLVEHYLEKRIMSFVHFSIGMEGSAVSVCSNLGKDDQVFGGHRGHAIYLAKGGNPGEMVAEMLGKQSGCSKGFGGSMHLVDKRVNFMGTTPILGPAASIGCGAALAKKLKKENGIVVSFIGDGASEQSEFYSTLNFAALHDLPFLVVIENNLFSVNSPLSVRRSPRRSTKGIVESFGCKYFRADGNNFQDSNHIAKEAIRITRSGMPTVLEMKVFREKAHSAPINEEKYRVEDTKEKRDGQDPVKRLKYHLEFFGEDLTKIEEQVELEAAAAMEFGINAI